MLAATIDLARTLMNHPSQIRNLSVIAHVDHGKSTLTDALETAAGIMKWREDTLLGLMTGKTTANVLRYTMMTPNRTRGGSETDEEGNKTEVAPAGGSLSDKQLCNEFLINVIASPGHVDFGFEMTAALRITDGALIVVDCIEGVCMSTMTESVLCQALTERIRPALFINKADRAITELQWDPEETYQCFVKIVESVNVVIATYNDPSMGDLQLSPKKGNISFGSGLQSWAFSVPRFAALYASKFGVEESKMCERLWGDSFFDAKNKKWIRTEVNQDGERLKRAFCQFCLEPIYQIFDAVLTEKKDKLEKMLTALNVELTPLERNQKPKQLLQTVMMKFLPAAGTLLQMVVLHLPSPKEAQAYRAEMLYAGEPNEANDKYYRGIKHCDQTAPLVLYVSRMVPTTIPRVGLFAFGRVFSGKVRAGQKVRIMGNNYDPNGGGKRQDLFEHKPVVQRTMLIMGRYTHAIEDIPCGNVCGLLGVDKYIVKSATISDDGETPYPLRDMKYSVSPCVRVAVQPKHVSDLPKLIEGLKRLAMTDPMVVCSVEESGEHIIAGTGELHLEVCLKDLQYDFMNGAPLVASEPMVLFRETVTAASGILCLAKSPNKHNRLYCRGAPLTEDLSRDIEERGGTAAAADADPKVRARFLADQHGWDIDGEACKIWSYGPFHRGPNMLLDMTKGRVQNMHELKDSFVAAWQWATREGVLCNENMRGVRVNIEDVTINSDAIHRGSGQILPPARRVFYASFLTAQPRLMEPVFSVEIQTAAHAVEAIHAELSSRRGIILSEGNRIGTPIFDIKASLPVVESFGLVAALRASTHTYVRSQCVFDHWQQVPGDPLVADTPAYDMVTVIRTHKGLKPEISTLDCFLDKM